jgi:type IV secretory pathway VirB10-like protein
MIGGRIFCAVSFACVCSACTYAQDPPPAPTPASNAVLTKRALSAPTAAPFDASGAITETIPLTVPKGTPVQVALDDEVRVRSAGQSIKGHVVEPVYAFDKLLIPVGTIVTGQIKKIEGLSAGKRTMAAMDADFTPEHEVQVEFNELVLPDGKHVPVQTSVTLGSSQLLDFATAGDDERKKGVKDIASEKAQEAREQAKREWHAAMQQVKQSGKMHRIKRAALSQLPAHPQYIAAGTVYFAELQDPLEFGTEPLTLQLASSLASPSPDGSFVHARLVTALSSATTQKGEDVVAIVSRPVLDGDRLLIPQGASLRGSVVQVGPARHLNHNGQLRFVFHDLILPNGLNQKVEAILQGVQAGKADAVKLDTEGGTQASTPKMKYLSTAVSVALAASVHEDDPINRAEGGGGGFKLVGIAMGLAVRSQSLGLAMGAFGASKSIYTHFIGRGHDVSFPKNTAMEIGIGTRPPATATAPTKPKGI